MVDKDNNSLGLIVTVVGIEGSGKTTLLKRYSGE
jgi:ABC-type cobalamin/Fe3+-siderophores transport system ATPase subunit